ncbi:hypothetical protein Scep_004082 [Stephania cephalantha]|uniref:Uncharacterized protein n=1 Tax=Stephania cephalantha TaxID=152367 RepID=A0AAP0PV33_9MAGN
MIDHWFHQIPLQTPVLFPISSSPPLRHRHQQQQQPLISSARHHAPRPLLRRPEYHRHGPDHPLRAPHPRLLEPRRVPKARLICTYWPPLRLSYPLFRPRRVPIQVLHNHCWGQFRVRVVEGARARRAWGFRSEGRGGGVLRQDLLRNSVATGEVYPLESEARVCDECNTGDSVTVELAENLLINHPAGKECRLKPIGDAGPIIEAGGIFAYARNTGMISSSHVCLDCW